MSANSAFANFNLSCFTCVFKHMGRIRKPIRGFYNILVLIRGRVFHQSTTDKTSVVDYFCDDFRSNERRKPPNIPFFWMKCSSNTWKRIFKWFNNREFEFDSIINSCCKSDSCVVCTIICLDRISNGFWNAYSLSSMRFLQMSLTFLWVAQYIIIRGLWTIMLGLYIWLAVLDI